MPALEAGNVTVEVSNNGVDFTSGNVQIEVVEDLAVSAALPSYGSVSGGSRVTVVGTGFSPVSSLACSFDGVRASATFVSARQAVCTCPPHAQGDVDVRVTADGATFSTAAAVFEYRHGLDSAVAAVSPSRGAVSGGTSVSVTGSGFGSDELQCVIGGVHAAAASWRSSTLVVCVS